MESLEKNLGEGEPQLSKKEKKLLKREQKEERQKRERQKRKLKKVIKLFLLSLVIGIGIGGIGLLLAKKSSPLESEIISRKGIHWHANLSIRISGQYQNIPDNIGRGITEQYIHTHEPDGVIHMEFPGLVKVDDIRLKRFFEIWGKKFNKDCIFDQCSGPEGKLKMLVNEKENSEFENYIMQDGDKIEVIFE